MGQKVNAQDVVKLRQRTQAGILDCQEALKATSGDLEKAVDWLRKKGAARADAKAMRQAKEGLIGIKNQINSAVIVEVNCETDFVAKNEEFKNFVRAVTDLAATKHPKDVEELLKQTLASASIADTLRDLVGKMGENMAIRRLAVIDQVDYVESYLHPLGGKIGVLLALESKAEKEKLKSLAKDLAMHIAASAPAYLAEKDVPKERIEREKEIYREQIKDKPAQVAEKIIANKLSKFYEDNCLMEQFFVKDPAKKVKEVIKEAEQRVGQAIGIIKFYRFKVGEEN
jgi:elongation factor Ts